MLFGKFAEKKGGVDFFLNMDKRIKQEFVNKEREKVNEKVDYFLLNLKHD